MWWKNNRDLKLINKIFYKKHSNMGVFFDIINKAKYTI